jgi:outer membrane lipoprotein LolB
LIQSPKLISPRVGEFFLPARCGLLTLLATLLFAGCATAPTTPSTPQITPGIVQQQLASLAEIHQFGLKGRLGVVTQKQGFTGSISWQHDMTNDHIEVFSPLGGKVATIEKSPTQISITSQDGKQVTAKDAETLTETTLGWQLPLAGLNRWALGKPTESKIDAMTWDDNGRLTSLKQEGWDIQYSEYTVNNGYALPGKVLLKSEKVNLKLLIENWQLM